VRRDSPQYRMRHAVIRTRLLSTGAEALADEEILELALARAVRAARTPSMVLKLLNEFGSLGNIIASPVQTLRAIPGLGEDGIAALKLMQAGALRLAREEALGGPLLGDWDRLMKYLTAALGREKVEQVRVLYLDPRNRLLGDEALPRGTINHAPLYPREVIKRALELHATGLILVHNHPSGDPTPSHGDICLTHEMAAAAYTLSIALHDHIIVGNGRWLSFRKEGLLSNAAGAPRSLPVPHLGQVSMASDHECSGRTPTCKHMRRSGTHLIIRTVVSRGEQ
jgi:DNA repair protein RadC